MSCIVFYEKPGCATNRLQKQLLRATGLQLDVRNLMATQWTAEQLRPFFGNKPVAEWFNASAPAIKYGELDPTSLTADQALALMIDNPLLIRRPLIRYGIHFMVGFDLPTLSQQLPCKGHFPNLPADASPASPLSGCSVGQHSQVGCVPAAQGSR